MSRGGNYVNSIVVKYGTVQDNFSALSVNAHFFFLAVNDK